MPPELMCWTYSKYYTAIVWTTNGDFPGEDPATEGTIVRYFHHPHVGTSSLDPRCGQSWHNHGWLEALDRLVCPGNLIIIDNGYAEDPTVTPVAVIDQQTYIALFRSHDTAGIKP